MKIVDQSLYDINENDNMNGTVMIPTVGVKKIAKVVFFNTPFLHYIVIPNNIELIEDRAFLDCTMLKKVIIKEGTKRVGVEAFKECTSLKEIDLNNSVEKIDEGCFLKCTSLKKVKLPVNLKEISNNLFSYCNSLIDVTLGDHIETIGDFAFNNCILLENINIPDNVYFLGTRAFNNCKSLKKIQLSSNIETIKKHTFFCCTNLKEIILPSKLKTIEVGAFSECQSLKRVYLNESIKSIYDNAFLNCNNLELINIPLNINYIGTRAFAGTNLKYLVKLDGQYYLSKTKKDKDFVCISGISHSFLPFIIRNWDIKDSIIKDLTSYNFDKIYISMRDNDLALRDFITSKNMVFYRKICFEENISQANIESFNILYYNLGGFLKNSYITPSGKEINYAQKVGVFLKEKIEKGELKIEEIHQHFHDMKIGGFKKEFSDFFLNKINFNELIMEENRQKGFITRCYNEFEHVMFTHTSNKGRQRQLAPTVEKFRKSFATKKFEGINDENRVLANVISEYFSDQSDFNNACDILSTKEEQGIRDNILNDALKESDAFRNITDYERKILNISIKTIGPLEELARKNFTFEWLKKNDPYNFVLGKLCNCCSHLAGMGYGVMKASVVHPNIQNLIIRNDKGIIIAKSTLYINEEEQYGIFNTVEVKSFLLKEDKEKIYSKYKLGVLSFIEKYNQEHPDKPLLKVNVGMGNNDLYMEISDKNNKEIDLVKGMDYSFYKLIDEMYTNDTSDEQYILWKSKTRK